MHTRVMRSVSSEGIRNVARRSNRTREGKDLVRDSSRAGSRLKRNREPGAGEDGGQATDALNAP
jgi:hypothetical protein